MEFLILVAILVFIFGLLDMAVFEDNDDDN
jgi:hypothetical protein